MLLIRTGPNPLMTGCSKTAAIWNSSNAGTPCGTCRAGSATLWVPSLNAILDPLTKPRSTTLEDENGDTTPIPDERPYGQRLHDGLDEACGRLLKMKDQPVSGGTPA